MALSYDVTDMTSSANKATRVDHMTDRKRRKALRSVAWFLSKIKAEWINETAPMWTKRHKSWGKKSSNILLALKCGSVFFNIVVVIVQSGLKLYNFTTLTAGVVDFLKSPSLLISGSGGRPARKAPAPSRSVFWGFTLPKSRFQKKKTLWARLVGKSKGTLVGDFLRGLGLRVWKIVCERH